jgi:hypothetical protein
MLEALHAESASSLIADYTGLSLGGFGDARLDKRGRRFWSGSSIANASACASSQAATAPRKSPSAGFSPTRE